MSSVIKVLGREGRRGFTLVEVMVATMIAVLTVASAHSLLSHSISIMRSTANRSAAFHAACSGIEYLRAQKYDSSELGTGDHTTSIHGQSISYTVSDLGVSGAKGLSVSVDWYSDLSGQTKSVVLTTVLASQLHY